ncbi:UNVERIFIED_ORG: regulator of replication initiation timing [Variovorax paradoxus]|nr:regulator of replication initiation timing [Variovorax paradoxus]
MNSEHTPPQETAGPALGPQTLETHDGTVKPSGEAKERVEATEPMAAATHSPYSPLAYSASINQGEGVPPSPRSHQEHKVWAAADALLIDGERPTIERVRKKLGGGSPNTIAPILAGWFATLGSRLTNNPGSAPPNAAHIHMAATPRSAVDIDRNIPPIVQSAANKFWMNAQAEARRALADQAANVQAEEQRNRMHIEAEKAQLLLEQTSFARARAGLESALASARQALNAMREQVEDAARAQHESECEVARLKYRLAQAHAEQDRHRRSLDKEQAQRSEDAREMGFQAAEREKYLLSEIEQERSAKQQVLADLLKEQEGRLRAEQELVRARSSNT